MKQCCTIDNLSLATGDGTSKCRVNCLTCKTCGNQESFCYINENELNVIYSYGAFSSLRTKLHLPLFSPSHYLPGDIIDDSSR